MVCRRGEIRLANFNPAKGTEPGKIRPCLIIQSDLLNDARHPSTTVIPLTSRLVDNAVPLRYRISARDDLRSDSEVVLDQARTIDNRRISNETLTTLTGQELAVVEEYLRIVLGFDVLDDVKIPNAETIEALRQARSGKGLTEYDNLENLKAGHG